MPNEYLDNLNDAQKRAVTSPAGPLLVQAGPGTGKTRVLSCRIAHQSRCMEGGGVLAITFTNKAASEIAERVKSLASDAVGAGRVQVATFHGWALGFLREFYGDKVREVAGEADARSILAGALKDAGIRVNARRIQSAVSRVKEHYPVRLPEEDAELERYLELYSAALEHYGMWDYDDLIIEAARLLEQPDVAQAFRSGISAVLVDEFQDVSPAQYALLRLMTTPAGNVTVIGDVNQAIYGFRGASPEFIKRFRKDYENVVEVTLDRAYRCPQVFLDAARRVVGEASAPALVSEKGRGSEIIFKAHKNPGDEARWIALEIEKNVGGLSFDSMNAGRAGGDEMRSLGDVAVLFRTRRIGDQVAQALFEEGIPFQLSAMPDPLEQPELQNIYRLWEAVKGRAADFHLSRLPGPRKFWVSRGNLLKSAAARLSPAELLKEMAKMLEIDPELPEIAGLADALEKNPQVESLSLLMRNEVEIIRSRTEAVSLLSLHASKGLEFPIVFIAGCDEGIIPWKGSSLDEETRLFYVGLTRASERLYLTYPRKRPVNGAVKSRKPSRFIKRIPEELRKTPDTAKRRVRRPMKRLQKSLFG